MSIRQLEPEKLSEVSMVDIVYALLNEAKSPQSFYDVMKEAQQIKGISDEEAQTAMPRLYTEMNIDGRFKSLGDNAWGLRSWYPVEKEDGITDTKKKPKRKKAAKAAHKADEDLDLDIEEDVDLDLDDVESELEDELDEDDVDLDGDAEDDDEAVDV